jgi:hypothetical protein
MLIDKIPFDMDKTTVAVRLRPPVMIKALSNAFEKLGMSPRADLHHARMRKTCGVGNAGM